MSLQPQLSFHEHIFLETFAGKRSQMHHFKSIGANYFGMVNYVMIRDLCLKCVSKRLQYIHIERNISWAYQIVGSR